ncbi:MAG TPA: class I SAM-dependent methyltransferase [Chloroflexia bacterium]|nr:class I SAM-dependent methyltransferase [Chloroflexia bacterium]
MSATPDFTLENPAAAPGAPGAGAAATAFSRAAPLYDAEQQANPIARWTRARSLAVLAGAWQPGTRVLELGCGTGAEAIQLAARGVEIVATDAAPGMIALLAAKLAPGGPAAPLAARITPLVLRAAEAGQLIERYGPAAFAGAYSSFGPLNCEPALAPVAAALATLVRPGGHVILSLINRYCLWETAWYLRAGRPALAARRWSGRSRATVRAAWPETQIPIFYWTPGAVEQAFRPHFQTVRRLGLPWLLPPQYLDGLVRRAPHLFRRLARLDRRLAGTWPCYTLGDHFLLELVRQ